MNKVLYVIFPLIILCIGCTKDRTSPKRDCISCSVEISFKNDVQPILTNNCATAGCHDFDDASGGLELDSAVAYSQLFQTGSGYVNPGDAKSSIVYINISPGASDPMPQSYSLSSCDINTIYCWIQQGGKNN